MNNRITLIIALLGMILTLHMWVQKERGFDAGCFGLASAKMQTATVSGCQEAMEGDSSTTFGIDNVIAGFSFYSLMAILCLALVFTAGNVRKKIKLFQLGLSGAALIFTCYFLYLLFFQMHSLCILCLTSAAMIATLFGLRLVDVRNKEKTSKKEEPGAMVTELAVTTLSVFVAGVLLVADLIFLNNIAGAGATDTTEIRTIANSVLETRIGAAFLERMAPCSIDDTKPVVNWESLIMPNDPFMGNPNARVTVLEFFDPNCPHCKMVHAVMKRVIERFSDRVRFFTKPYALWPKSLSQIEAIWLAAGSGKYYEMIEMQFQSQVHEGLPLSTVKLMGENLGLDNPEFTRALDEQTLRQKVLQDKQMIKAAGIEAAPVILLNGKFVGRPGQSLTIDCISNLIEQELLALPH